MQIQSKVTLVLHWVFQWPNYVISFAFEHVSRFWTRQSAFTPSQFIRVLIMLHTKNDVRRSFGTTISFHYIPLHSCFDSNVQKPSVPALSNSSTVASTRKGVMHQESIEFIIHRRKMQSPNHNLGDHSVHMLAKGLQWTWLLARLKRPRPKTKQVITYQVTRMHAPLCSDSQLWKNTTAVITRICVKNRFPIGPRWLAVWPLRIRRVRRLRHDEQNRFTSCSTFGARGLAVSPLRIRGSGDIREFQEIRVLGYESKIDNIWNDNELAFTSTHFIRV